MSNSGRKKKEKLPEEIIINTTLDIDPHVFLDIELKYKKYLKLIDFFGGYMFYQHIFLFSDKKQTATYRDIKGMENISLLKSVKLNNNNYVILQRAALRYLKNKPGVGALNPPTSTILKTAAYLAEYIYLFCDKDIEESLIKRHEKAYSSFLEKYMSEAKNYKEGKAADVKFLSNNKNIVNVFKSEYEAYKEEKDILSSLSSSRIYVADISQENRKLKLILLDIERSKLWIKRVIVEKIEPIYKKMMYYNYDIEVITCNKGREERLRSDMEKLQIELKQENKAFFLKGISVKNLNIDRFFENISEKESYLKPVEQLEVAKLQEKIKSLTKN